VGTKLLAADVKIASRLTGKIAAGKTLTRYAAVPDAACLPLLLLCHCGVPCAMCHACGALCCIAVNMRGCPVCLCSLRQICCQIGWLLLIGRLACLPACLLFACCRRERTQLTRTSADIFR
jgi:hypothetical protein